MPNLRASVIKFDGDTMTDLPSTATTRAGVVVAVRAAGTGWKYDVKLGGE